MARSSSPAARWSNWSPARRRIPAALAEAIIRIIHNRQDYQRPRSLIEDTFSLERTMGGYETLFEELLECRLMTSRPVQEMESERQ